MAKNYDLTNERFGRLFVIRLKERGRSKYWECVCDCGNVISATTTHLITGHTVSCGCKSRENRERRNYKHGLCIKSRRLYGIYHAMLNRCLNPLNVQYKRYGGRGITVCNEWKNNIQSFFDWAFSNGYDDSLSIDRIESDGNYEPSNCRWTTDKEQARNKSSNIKITYNGETKVLSDWAAEKGIRVSVLRFRIKRGWDIHTALEKPVKFGNRVIK